MPLLYNSAAKTRCYGEHAPSEGGWSQIAEDSEVSGVLRFGERLLLSQSNFAVFIIHHRLHLVPLVPSAHPSSYVLAVKVKAYELRSKGRDDLIRQLDELKTELQQLRVAKRKLRERVYEQCLSPSCGGLWFAIMFDGFGGGLPSSPATSSGSSSSLTRAFGVSSKVVRKSIARVLTVINQNKKDAVREAYKDKVHIPLDIRTKKTRALRRKLTYKQSEKMTLKAKTKSQHFPLRKYAVKA
eukprot:401374-Rhodomonas_salina.2